MAKKIQIDIEVNGKMQKATVSAKKLRDALDGTAKSARTTDRNIKGASQQSANATKNFSKMAQGMTGTLVPAYATLAANVFAISAAFNFLKSAGDLKALEEGQKAYAAGTGIAIKALTNDIVDATNAQISFQDAAQASAIGLAAGLSQKQLKELGTAAKDVSLVLGRDVTDSFNRLIRGVTKAEPELLDELGIILRLETATENYAVALGKNAKDLTQFEKSQAIANEVLTQTEQKYSSMLTSQEQLANSFAKLGKSFENEFLKPLKIGIADVLTPIVDFLSQNLTALAAVLTLVALPITRAIIPSLDGWAKSSMKAAGQASRSYKKAQKDIERLKIAQEELRVSQADPNIAAQGALKGVQSRSSGISKFQKGDFGALSKKEINALLRAAEGGKGAVTQMSAQMKAQYIAALRAIKNESKTTFGTVKVTMKSVGTQWKIITTGMVVAWKKATVQFKLLAVKAAKGIDFAFKAMGWIGWILLGIDLITMAYDTLVGYFETEEQKERKIFEEKEKERIDGVRESLAAVNEEMTGILQRTNAMSGGLGVGSFLSNFLGNVDLLSLREMLSMGDQTGMAAIGNIAGGAFMSGNEFFQRQGSVLTSAVGALSRANPEDEAGRKALLDIITQTVSEMQEQAQTAQLLQQSLNTQVELESKLLNSMVPRSQYDNAIAQYKKTQELAAENLVTLSAEEQANLERGVKLHDIMVKLRQHELGIANEAKEREIASTKMLRESTKEQAAVIQGLDAEFKIENKIDLLNQKKKLFKEGGIDLTDAQVTAMNSELRLLEEQLLTAQQKTDLAQIELDFVRQIRREQELAANISLGKAQQRGMLGVFGAQRGRELAEASAILNVTKAQSDLNKSMAKRDTVGYEEGTGKREELDHTIKLQQLALATQEEYLDQARKSLTDIGRIGLGVGNVLNDSMQTAFDGLIQGTMTAKEAFASMATSMLQSISKIIAELLTAKILTAALGGTSFGTFLGIGNRYGGVMSNGAKAPGYAVGGVAKGPQSGYPAVLHGTEAIVPLPNGKSIPVDMKGAGQNNNVTVNVAIDSNGNSKQDSQASSNEGANLGAVIATAVQKELQNQKRAGGILSSMGAS